MLPLMIVPDETSRGLAILFIYLSLPHWIKAFRVCQPGGPSQERPDFLPP